MGWLVVTDDSLLLEVVKGWSARGAGRGGRSRDHAAPRSPCRSSRYRTGDIVTRGPAPCTCGAPFSAVLTVQGRMIDYFERPDGRRMHPNEMVVDLLRQAGRWIAQYQLTQRHEAASSCGSRRFIHRRRRKWRPSASTRLGPCLAPVSTSAPCWCRRSRSRRTGSSGSADRSCVPSTTRSTGNAVAPTIAALRRR